MACDKRKQLETKERAQTIKRFVDLPFYESPENEEQQLMNYQYQYLNDNSQVGWAKLWELAYKVTGKILANFCKKRHIGFCSDDYEDKVSEAVLYVLRRYKTSPDYCIKKNFVLQLWYGVKHVLDHRTKAEKLEENLIKVLNQGDYKIDGCSVNGEAEDSLSQTRNGDS